MSRIFAASKCQTLLVWMKVIKSPAGSLGKNNMDKLIEVTGLTKRYTQGNVIARTVITAVDHISFYIKPAEIFTLAGESGCGKTTTAKIVLGFEEATSGAILHNGKLQTPREKTWITEGAKLSGQEKR